MKHPHRPPYVSHISIIHVHLFPYKFMTIRLPRKVVIKQTKTLAGETCNIMSRTTFKRNKGYTKQAVCIRFKTTLPLLRKGRPLPRGIRSWGRSSIVQWWYPQALSPPGSWWLGKAGTATQKHVSVTSKIKFNTVTISVYHAVADPRGGGVRNRRPLKLDRLCFFIHFFFIRMLKNKAQIARESVIKQP